MSAAGLFPEPGQGIELGDAGGSAQCRHATEETERDSATHHSSLVCSTSHIVLHVIVYNDEGSLALIAQGVVYAITWLERSCDCGR
jgi:hypothetical protein